MTKVDAWQKLKSFTGARIALGRAGGSLTTVEMLQFRKDHALARDAVWTDLDINKLAEQIEQSLSSKTVALHSQAADRQMYIQRPDLGRRLDENSVNLLKGRYSKEPFDMSISVADGLSALAISQHAIPFLKHFLPLITPFRVTPLALVSQGRVAISDEIGQLMGSQLSIILIGERPGLSSPDSMGIYLTYNPQVGNTDERRNCISNIRKEGLSYEFAAQKLAFMSSEALRRKISGVDLKDTFESDSPSPLNP